MKHLSFSTALLLLLAGCSTPTEQMVSFDKQVERAHQDYMVLQTNRLENDWYVNYWYGKFLQDKQNRGVPFCEGITNDWNLEPSTGIWAQFSGNCMLLDIKRTK
jgi:hypothetical protein